MPAVNSNMIELGTKAPDFILPNVISGSLASIDSLRGDKATLIIFICNHCPYVVHCIDRIVELATEYSTKGVSTIAINSNDVVKYPDDSPENMKLFAEKYQFSFPYLFDLSQQIAKDYQAACTPDFFLYDQNLSLIYRGQFDTSRPSNNNPVTGKDLKEAIESAVQGLPPILNQIPSIGCSIKWK